MEPEKSIVLTLSCFARNTGGKTEEIMEQAREAALKILYTWEKNKGYLNILYQNYIQQNQLTTQDRHLIKELSTGVVRQKMALDYIIAAYSNLRLKKLSPYILNILRLGVYQLFYMDRIPVRACVNESVRLAKKYGHSSSAGFVNAVLRKAASCGMPAWPDRKKGTAHALSVQYSHPEPLVEYFLRWLGTERAEELLSANNETPPVFLRANSLRTTRERLLDQLRTEGAAAAKASGRSPCALCLTQGGAVAQLSAFQEGLFQIQDLSSQEAVFLLAPKPGERVWDVCAAPGGKTAALAEQMENRGEILATDLYASRLNLVRQNAERLGITIIRTAACDASEENAAVEGQFDKILLDAPCSGLGVIRRKPDIKYRENLADFEEMVKIQKKLLKNCAKYLKIGGELLYSTCTINPAEDVLAVRSFLEENAGFAACSAPEDGVFPEMDGQNRDLPHALVRYPSSAGGDGFFAFKMVRRA